ncbi:MAG: hypothetical protein GKS05_05545 [Nitrospirales bacterium]|nr:hypothetical protein [Nitrospirales bacterium]
MKHIINRILFATDISQSALPAFHTALTWANACDAMLDIVHVMGVMHEVDLDSAVANRYIKGQRERLKSELDQLASQANETLSAVHVHMLEGLPVNMIATFAQTSQADLVITGTHGWGGINHVMLGSVAERVICQAPCPVLSVRDVEAEKTASTDKLNFSARDSAPRHILLPIDFSDCSLDAYEYAVNLEKSFDTSVTLLHALGPFSYSLDFTLSRPVEDRQHREKVKSRLADLTKAFTREGFRASYVIKNKPASEAIIETRTESGADLIIMGTHGHRGLRRLIMGNVAAAVLRQSPVPVLTVKSQKFKHESEKPARESVQATHL